jgi:signal transduction histidine kinase
VTKKSTLLAAQLINDPSLRWCAYRMWEVVWSDVHQIELRFVRYENGKAKLASLAGMAELPDLVDPLSVRRPTVHKDYGTKISEAERSRIARDLIAVRRKH